MDTRKAARDLQLVALGMFLGSKALAKDANETSFIDDVLSRIVEGLKSGNMEPLTAWLDDRGCRVQGTVSGSILDHLESVAKRRKLWKGMLRAVQDQSHPRDWLAKYGPLTGEKNEQAQ